MSETYCLRDMDNRDDDGVPFEFSVPTLAEMIPYVDGALRGDVRDPEGQEAVDEAVDALRREWFQTAQARLKELGVYIDLEAIHDC